ncbi:hypothetical protein GGI21_003063 [Coemansia aciculifera]|nr:hypothetical protein GGI21_003063 [Coemansia aciculifera]
MTEACRFDLESRIFGHCMSSTGAHALIAAAADASAYIRLCDLRTGSFAQSLLAHDSSGCMAAAWSPVRPFVMASGGIDGTLKLWDIRRADSQLCSFGGGDTKAHDGSVSSLLFTGDGTRIVTLESSRPSICVWDVARPNDCVTECLLDTMGTRGGTGSGAVQMALTTAATLYSADFELLFCPSAGSYGGGIAAVDMDTGKQIALLNCHFAPVLCAVWRPDHLELYSSGTDGNVLIWCPPAAEELSDEQKSIRADTWSPINE